jgi:regulator of sigma E protease
VVFACIVWAVQRPVPVGNESTVIGYIMPDLPAAESDLRVGDRILKIDGEAVDKWDGAVASVTWGILSSEGEQILFGVERDGEVVEVPVKAPREKIEEEWAQRSWTQKIFTRKPFMRVGLEPESETLIRSVMENSPAAVAGLRKMDVVKSVNGKVPASPLAAHFEVKAGKGKTTEFEVLRGDEVLKISVTPRLPDSPKDYKDPMIGVGFGHPAKSELVHESPVAQIEHSLAMMYNTLTKVFAPRSKLGAQHLSGPVGIMNLYYQLFQSPDGWRLVLWFSVVLNINLAILNLLPFPVLDGGHITMASLEILRRKPINTRLLEYVQLACVMLLFGFMLFVTMKDLGQIAGVGNEAGGEIKFNPPDGGGKE